jgi:putative FmdB family regulatory protein
MPIYEYKCKDCGVHIEKRQNVSDEPLTVCEKCGGKLEKQISLSGFQFKGEGWYVTDYAGKKSGGTESTASANSASKSTDDKSVSSKKPASDKSSSSTETTAAKPSTSE